MAIDSKHPLYAHYIDDWCLMRDAKEGERAVKDKGVKYLPATPGQILDGVDNPNKPGYTAYQNYKKRAVFPDYVDDAVKTYLGLLHQKPAVFELPPAMEPLLSKATNQGESLLALLRRLNEEQLTTGRIGLMLDMPENPDPTSPLPYITTYIVEDMINWDESDDHNGVNALNLVVLDETKYERDNDFNWELKERYRVLQLVDQSAIASGEPQIAEENAHGTEGPDIAIDRIDVTERPFASRVYMAGVFERGHNPSPSMLKPPLLRGVPLEEIPFVFLNSQDILPAPDKPPLLGLGKMCLAIYRGEADYRYSLYMQGQDTLVVIGNTTKGEDEEMRVGAGSRIDVDMGGDAKYIGVSSTGLAEQRVSIENDRKLAERLAGQLIQPGKNSQESGEALKTRMAGQVATLFQMAMASALALENILKIAARWMGQDPEKVKVSPNLEFVSQALTGQDVLQMMTARTMGAPLSFKSMHDKFIDSSLTSMTYEEELDQIAEEDAERATRLAEEPAPNSMAPGSEQPPKEGE